MSMLEVGKAREIVAEIPAEPGKPVTLPLWEAAGHVLAEDVITGRDIPPFNRSAMDGYAVRSEDVVAVPTTLEVVAIREAGDTGPIPIGPGQCVKIMTGAAVPEDADAVVMVEKTESADPARTVTILDSPRVWTNIARRGEDAVKGAVVMPAGVRLNARVLSVAAGVGRAELSVHPQPVVSILQTGGELLEPGDAPEDNKIYNSNATLLAALLKDAGLGKCRYLGICPDEKERLAERVRKGLEGDMLLLTGGVSKGDYDYVPDVLAEAGVEIHFHRLAVKPGRPILFGSVKGGAKVFGLPGNPNSVLVSFKEFVLPLLRRLAGWTGPVFAADATAILSTPLKKKPGRQFNCPAQLTFEDGRLLAAPIPGKGSGDYVSASRANGIVVLPAHCAGAAAGDEVTAHFWELPLG